MGCPQAENVRRLLVGSLDSSKTLAVMDHTRECDACKEQLKLHSAGASKRERTGVPRITDERLALRAWSSDAPVSRSGNARGRSMATRRLFILSSAIVVFFLWQMSKAAQKDDVPATSDEIVIERAINEGLPWAETPRGKLVARPKVTAVILPEGTHEFAVHYVVKGVEIHTRRWTRGDRGAQFDAVDRRGENGTYGAVSALVPFPKRDEVAMGTDVPITWYVTLLDGKESAPARFVLAPRE